MVVICKSGEDVVTGSIKVDARDVCVCLGRQKLWFLGQKMSGYLCTVVDHLRKVCSLPQPHAIDKKTPASFRQNRVLWKTH